MKKFIFVFFHTKSTGCVAMTTPTFDVILTGQHDPVEGGTSNYCCAKMTVKDELQHH